MLNPNLRYLLINNPDGSFGDCKQTVFLKYGESTVVDDALNLYLMKNLA